MIVHFDSEDTRLSLACCLSHKDVNLITISYFETLCSMHTPDWANLPRLQLHSSRLE